MFTPTPIGRLFFEHENETWGESEESKAAYARCEAEFAKYNPEPTLDEQNDMFDAVVGYGAVERREGFIDGFKYAVKLMGEVYAVPESNQRGSDT